VRAGRRPHAELVEIVLGALGATPCCATACRSTWRRRPATRRRRSPPRSTTPPSCPAFVRWDEASAYAERLDRVLDAL
jgi:hypothetical protein